jgi:DNA-binding winged helix-turn-helix (wHTH) protein
VEFKLLYHLARNAGTLLTHEALLQRIWGPDSMRTHDHLRVYVSRVRSKIERAGGPDCIETERGIGYRFVRPPDTPEPGGYPGQDAPEHQAERAGTSAETEMGPGCPRISYTV